MFRLRLLACLAVLVGLLAAPRSALAVTETSPPRDVENAQRAEQRTERATADGRAAVFDHRIRPAEQVTDPDPVTAVRRRFVVALDDGPIHVVQRRMYDEWGQLVTDWHESGFDPVPIGFAGGLWDPTAQTLHFGVRESSPALGRWLSKDPIGFEAGQANWYEYVGGDPVHRADPSGACPWCIGAAIGFGADLAYQLASNGGSFRCVNVGQLALATGIGALGGYAFGRALGGGLAAGGAGTRGAQQTFEILDGVRRAKAVEMAGGSTIRAEVLASGGRIVEVPLDALRSPKTVMTRRPTPAGPGG